VQSRRQPSARSPVEAGHEHHDDAPQAPGHLALRQPQHGGHLCRWDAVQRHAQDRELDGLEPRAELLEGHGGHWGQHLEPAAGGAQCLQELAHVGRLADHGVRPRESSGQGELGGIVA
jgi:hypothetical protein